MVKDNLYVVAIDVDLVMVNPAPLWEKHIEYFNGVPKVVEGKRNYRICEDYEFPHGRPSNNSLVKGFWNNPKLYDKLKPMKGAKEMIDTLHNLGYTIVFVSHCFSGHLDSKRNFLLREIWDNGKLEEDFHFIATKSKGLVAADFIVDDRVKFLDQCNLIRKDHRFLVKSPYEQDYEHDYEEKSLKRITKEIVDKSFGLK